VRKDNLYICNVIFGQLYEIVVLCVHALKYFCISAIAEFHAILFVAVFFVIPLLPLV